ncbi:hypothetical protein J4Q44_G00385660 [Coregonus suidteri]|uniref:proteasome endopeptidase complex n=1 Tax=Coregonus suidteri TaxID=861788 RepID=A0AAN8QCA4_9TELE
MKTGTTIAGVVCKDGVVLGADTRATSGEVVADKMCAKIHYILPQYILLWCRNCSGHREDYRPALIQPHHLFYEQRQEPTCLYGSKHTTGHAIQVPGPDRGQSNPRRVDCTGNHLYTVGPYGSIDNVPYLAMGSGDLAALGILEDRFKPNMEMEEAKELVRDAIHSGIMSDLGSGNNIDICVITKQGVDYIRPYQESEYKDKSPQGSSGHAAVKVVVSIDLNHGTTTLAFKIRAWCHCGCGLQASAGSYIGKHHIL